eukprot:TRINITY_DN1222_c0_g1_i4.p1 TRINITY_DN1222_c0_g1~~TRINITY_DN1222_c0_g1_i4.p1  ORF type:complete len:831 (+),score=200.70 TRINITY_DN1222_c0_g1_i4:281-2773(+)
MAAGQQKRRLNAASVVSCNLQEQYRAKKKKHLESCQNVLNMRPHISLEWDDNQKRAVASREQIGITWRDIDLFVDSVPQLTGVLSYDVWETHLSESERNLLSQFLPRGTDVEKVVQPLLSGENLHFGNPFLEWGASLCSGDLHPDVVHRRDQYFKANKKAYYNELQKYHNDIVEHLLEWKDRWTRCKDPEKEIIQKMWRCSRKDAENSPSSHENEFRQHNLEENLAATSVSSPDFWDEKVCPSDKEITLGKKSGKHQERKGLVKHKGGCSPLVKAKVVANSRKEEKPHKLFIRTGDAAKYMSYFKISRKQHQLVKGIKQRGDGIQSKSLNRVLGDIKAFHVQPYEAFEEEERKKLHEHWLQVARRDLPAAFADYREKQLQRQQWRKSLDQELAEKKLAMDEDEENEIPETSLQEQENSGETEQQQAIDIQNCKDDESVSISVQRQPLQRIPSLNSHHELDPMVLDLEEGDQAAIKQEEDTTAPIPPHFLQNMITKEEVFEPEEVSVSPGKDLWPAVGTPGSYYQHTSVGHGYAPAGNLSLGQPQPINERQMIDLENDVVEGEAGGSLLHRPSSDVGSSLHFNNGGSFLGSYVNQDRNELLQPFLKVQSMLPSYPQVHVNNLKQPAGLPFLQVNDGPPGTRRFPRQFLDQQQGLFEQRQLKGELYMQQVKQKNLYSNGRYPSPELFSPVADTSNWPADSICLAPYQSSISSGLLGQNWYSGGVQVSGTEGQCLGGGSSADESLLSVLSQCNKLPPNSSYDPLSTEQYNIPSRNFVGNGGTFAYPSHQLNYLSGHETVAAVKENNMMWMNLSHQNPRPHDLIGKPYLRSWNQ